MKPRNWASLIITLIGAVNTSLIAFGAYHLSNEQLDSVNTIVSVVLTIVGIFMSHEKLPITKDDEDRSI